MPELKPQENHPAAAVLLMLLAFVVFSGMDTIAKVLVTSGMPPLQVSFLRYGVHFAVILAVFGPTSFRAMIRSRARGREVLRAALLLGSTVFNFTALVYLPLTVTIAIFFATPLAVCALSIPILGEKVGPRRWAAILVGFGGVLVITRPWDAEAHWAMLFAFASLTCASLYYVVTRLLAGIDHNMTMQFWGSGLCALFLAVPGIAVWETPAGAGDWVLLAVLGTLGAAGHLLVTAAHRLAAASVLAPTVYSQVIYVTLLSWLVFATLPDAPTIAGAAIVVGSGLYLWLRERQVKARTLRR